MSTRETRGQQITRTMATMGFQPKESATAKYVEYYKDYADSHGRTARCTALFHKGGVVAAMDHAKLAGFIVTVQSHVEPLHEDIVARAPKVMHTDMLHALTSLENVSAPKSVSSDMVVCDKCSKNTDQFIVTNSGKTMCPGCMKQNMNGGTVGKDSN